MLDVQHITKTFLKGTPNEHTALSDLSLHLQDGDFVTVIGSNGAGKSTLFSDAGVPHTYNLEEIGDGQLTVGGESKTGTFSYYLSTQGETTIRTNPGTPDLVTYEFTFDNTLTGTTRHTVHKTWQDRDSGGCDRPDLYLTLYRYLKSEAEASPDTPVEKLPS